MSRPRLMDRLKRVQSYASEHGVSALVGLVAQRFLIRRLVSAQTSSRMAAKVRAEIAAFCDGKAPVHVIWSTLDWRYPYRQRPHHLAQAFLARGAKVIFITPATGHDRVVTTEKVGEALLLTPAADLALAAPNITTAMLLSTDTRWQESHLDALAAQGAIVVYDYLDALDDSLSVGAITGERRALHQRLLADEANVVVASVADVLDQEVGRARKTGHAVVTNGVDLAPFLAAKRETAGLRADFAAVAAKGRPIIGYYGSLAAWFDYPLLRKIAEDRPDWEVVSIGPDLDGSSVAIGAPPANLHILPGMDYADIPAHGAWFDVGLVPFVINDITRATSPLKVFEYMALGMPIVSTPMPECRKYQSILIGEDHGDFLAKLSAALDLRGDERYRNLLAEEARANCWTTKAEMIETLAAQAAARRGPRPGR